MTWNYGEEAHLRIRQLLLPMSLTVVAAVNTRDEYKRGDLQWAWRDMAAAAVPAVRAISEETDAPAEVRAAVRNVMLRLMVLALIAWPDVDGDAYGGLGSQAEYFDAAVDAFDRLWADFKDRDAGESWPQVESLSTVEV